MSDDAPVTLDQLRLFSGARQFDNFWRMSQLFPTSRLEPSTQPYEWPRGASIELPDTYDHSGQAKSTGQLIEDTETAALLVLRDGEIVYEDDRLTGGPDVPSISMSVAKSFISTLVGIALDEGHIASIDEPVSAYVPVEPGSAYDGVSIRNVLQMSSGARWNEDYTDPPPTSCSSAQPPMAPASTASSPRWSARPSRTRCAATTRPGPRYWARSSSTPPDGRSPTTCKRSCTRRSAWSIPATG